MISKLIRIFNPFAMARARQRGVDHNVLFPKLIELSEGNQMALGRAIMLHIKIDPAWQHPEEFDDADIGIIDRCAVWQKLL